MYLTLIQNDFLVISRIRNIYNFFPRMDFTSSHLFNFRSVVKRTIRPLDFRVSGEQKNISMWIGQQSQNQFYYKVGSSENVVQGYRNIKLLILEFKKQVQLLFFILYLQGYIQNFHLVSGKTNAHSLQCPMVDLDCPTCGEFRSMQELVRKMQLEYQEEISRLKDRVK